MGYSNAKQGIRMRWNENLAAEAEGIRMHEGSIRIPEIQFECPREHSDMKGAAARRVSGCKNVYPNTNETIRILEDSIRMPATPRSRTTTNKSK